MLVSDKGVLYLYLRALGLRAPELLGIIHKVGDGWIRPQVIVRDAGEWERALTTLPHGLVVKPTRGHGGRGVRVLERRDGLLVDPAGGALTPGALWDALRATPSTTATSCRSACATTPTWPPWPARRRSTPSASSPSWATAAPWRCCGRRSSSACRGPASTTSPTAARATPSAASPSTTGRLMWTRTPVPGCYGTVAHARAHGRRRRPLRVPMWDEACALVRDAAPHFLPLRTLGWDIAITPGGPMIIEANAHWGAEVTSRMGAVFARMREA